MTPMMGRDDNNVDDSVNSNNIDSRNAISNADGSDDDVGGYTDYYDSTEANYVAIDYVAYISDADNSDVGSNANNDDANDADNDYDDESTKYGNNVGMDEVTMLLMIMALKMLILDLKPKMM